MDLKGSSDFFQNLQSYLLIISNKNRSHSKIAKIRGNFLFILLNNQIMKLHLKFYINIYLRNDYIETVLITIYDRNSLFLLSAPADSDFVGNA